MAELQTRIEQLKEHGSYLILLGKQIIDLADQLEAAGLGHMLTPSPSHVLLETPEGELESHEFKMPDVYDREIFLLDSMNQDALLKSGMEATRRGQVVLFHVGHKSQEACTELCWEPDEYDVLEYSNAKRTM